MADRLPEAVSVDSVDGGTRERASATPHQASKATSRSDPREPVAARPVSLASLQCWFADVIMSPGSTDERFAAANRRLEESGVVDVESIVTRGPWLAADDRVAIYQEAYHSRLIECLESDYPVLAQALGAGEWDRLCRSYIARHPSRSPSLNAFGSKLPGFAREWCVSSAVFFADLARLEWALVETVHAEEGEALDPAALSSIPADRWGEARFTKSPKARLLRLATPANAYFQAFYRDEAPTIPEPNDSATVIYRRNFVVWRMDLTPAMAIVLESLFRGDPLGLALSSVAAQSLSPEEEQEAERSVMTWFRAWMEAGLFDSVGLL